MTYFNDMLSHQQPTFTQSYSDASIYIYVKADVQVILPVFVDDMTFASTSAAAIDQLIVELSQHFKLRDLGATTQLLGIKIDRDRSKCWLLLTEHVIEVIEVSLKYVIEVIEVCH